MGSAHWGVGKHNGWSGCNAYHQCHTHPPAKRCHALMKLFDYNALLLSYSVPVSMAVRPRALCYQIMIRACSNLKVLGAVEGVACHKLVNCLPEQVPAEESCAGWFIHQFYIFLWRLTWAISMDVLTVWGFSLKEYLCLNHSLQNLFSLRAIQVS